MSNFLRTKVSLKKRRFVADGFNLDLACIVYNYPHQNHVLLLNTFF